MKRPATRTVLLACLCTPFAPAHPTPADRGGGPVGMIGDGWDGPGQHATTIFFHVRNAHPTDGPAQRRIILDALDAWSQVVQIHFVEIPIPYADRSIDFLFAVGDHCHIEPEECGSPQCVFNGMDPGFPGHAAYPPGVITHCGPVSVEPYAGDVHFDAHEAFRTGPGQNGWDFMLVAAHNIGHALGLRDNPNPSDHDVMFEFFTRDDNFLLLSATDIAQIQQGYLPGPGSLTTLEDLGVWVNSAWTGAELGSPGNPFNTLAEGIAGVPPFGDAVSVHVLGGLYPENLTISTPCIIRSEFGTAIIGH